MDSDQNIDTQIKERFHELPKALQEAIVSSDLSEKIKFIVNKHSLLIDEAGILEREILFVLLGLESSSDFVSNVSKEINLTTEEATLIAVDVNNSIFNEVKTHLKELDDLARQEEEEEKINRPSPSPIPAFTPKTTLTESKQLFKDASSYQPFAQPKKINLLEDDSTFTKESVKNDMAAAGITIHDESKQEFMEHGDPGKQGPPAQRVVEPPANLPGEEEIMGMTNEHTDALVDHLLGQVASAIQEKLSKKPPMPTPMPKPSDGSDTYREPFV